MTTEIIAALISGAIALIGFLITYSLTLKRGRQDQKRFEREISSKYGEKLYEMRLKHYGRAFELTDGLGKTYGKEETELPGYYKALIQDLREWKKGEVNLVLSDASIQCYYDLLDATKVNLALGDRYNEEQLERIWQKRYAFRVSLRSDLGLLRNVDKDMSPAN